MPETTEDKKKIFVKAVRKRQDDHTVNLRAKDWKEVGGSTSKAIDEKLAAIESDPVKYAIEIDLIDPDEDDMDEVDAEEVKAYLISRLLVPVSAGRIRELCGGKTATTSTASTTTTTTPASAS